jgi:hypothetical protein
LTKDLTGINVPPIVTAVDRSVRQWIEETGKRRVDCCALSYCDVREVAVAACPAIVLCKMYHPSKTVKPNRGNA